MPIVPIEYNNQRILTTEQLAEVYETDTSNIRVNFNSNKGRFIEGKHYFCLDGEQLRDFKNHVSETYVVNKHASHLYLWTERGANRHCKILDTDKAWEQFENLEETYFRVKEQKQALPMPSAAKFISGLASYLRIQRTIMLDRGCSALEVAQMSKRTCDLCGIPVPESLAPPVPYEQQMLPGFAPQSIEM